MAVAKYEPSSRRMMMATGFKTTPVERCWVSGRDFAEDVIEPAGRRPGTQRRGGIVGDDLAARDDHGARADRVHLFEDVRGDDDGLLLGDLADERADLVFLQRIEAIGGFVEDQHLG